MAEYPTTTPLPDHPVRGAPRDEFAAKANEFVAALPTFGQEVNQISSFVSFYSGEVAEDA